MELKLLNKSSNRITAPLLIVPYGIETFLLAKYLIIPNNLLIVPYGIETTFLALGLGCSLLLIVPYGIETHFP